MRRTIDIEPSDFTAIESPLGTFVVGRKVEHVAERKIRQVADMVDDDEAYPEHPLFPVPDDEPSVEVAFIQITRWESGRQVWGPCLPASDLPHEQALQEMFGGGQYSLVARRAQKGDKSKPSGITRSRKITLPGRPKPLSNDPTPDEEAAYDPTKRPPPVAAQASGGSPFGGGSGFENVFLAMMSMQQQAAERQATEARETARREAENSKNFMTMFLGMMQGAKADTANMMQMMMQLTSQQQTSMMQLLPALLGARGGGPEEMAKFADLFRSLGMGGAPAKAAGGDDANSLGSIISNAADVIQGFVALKSGMPSDPNSVAAPQSLPPAQPGSAQEMLERLKRGG
jgi:hypothetical protein